MERKKLTNIVLLVVSILSLVVSYAIDASYINIPSFGLDIHCQKSDLNSEGCFNRMIIDVIGILTYLFIAAVSGVLLFWRLLRSGVKK